MELEELKQLAFDQIVASITTSNVLMELLSDFTATYSSMRMVQLEFLRERWVRSFTLELNNSKLTSRIG